MNRLDELGRGASEQRLVPAPSLDQLRARAAGRRRRQRVVGAAVAVVVLVGGIAAVAAVDASDSSGSLTVAREPERSATPTTSVAPPPSTVTTMPVASITEVPTGRCGAWPGEVELWPGQPPGSVIGESSAVDQLGRLVLGRELDGYRLEVVWPALGQEDYDLGSEPPPELPVGILSDGSTSDVAFESELLEALSGRPGPSPALEPGPGGSERQVAVLRVPADAPSLAGPADGCEAFTLRLLDDDRLLGQVSFAFLSSDAEGSTGGMSLDFVDVDPIVVERRSVAEVPPSIRCGDAPSNPDMTFYRVLGELEPDLTLAEAVRRGLLEALPDPRSAVATTDPSETWAMLLPGSSPSETLGDLGEARLLTLTAGQYLEFADPSNIGATSGGGAPGAYEQPIDALRAFWLQPEAETFQRSGLVELTVDEETMAYGVPMDDGSGNWVTVIALERGPEGWSVTGWTSAGC